MGEAQANQVLRAALREWSAQLFHDLGKLDTPRDILEKPANLDDREREIIEKHPYHGAEKLLQSRDFRGLPLRAIHVALEHRQRGQHDIPALQEAQRQPLQPDRQITDFDAITTKRVTGRVTSRDDA
jgi:hypothetical protein